MKEGGGHFKNDRRLFYSYTNLSVSKRVCYIRANLRWRTGISWISDTGIFGQEPVPNSRF